MNEQTISNELLAQLKQIELDILKQFIKICQQLNLNYYVIGGTLLGAVRHKGFIPWDDDIDVGMLRKDYEVFVEQAQKLLPSPYFLQTYQTDAQYPHNFAKIRNSSTTFIEKSVSHKSINHGVYIDVFPLDYYPSGYLASKWFDFKFKTLHARIRSEFILTDKELPFYRRFVNWVCMKLAKLIYPDVRIALAKREKLMKSLSSSLLVANLCGAWGKKEIVPAEWYGPGTLVEFEELSYRAPVAYDKWLRQVYGNYMQLPPEEKRKAHHYTDIIDLEHSYTDYIQEREN